MKKALATILALVMAIGLCSVSWATEPASVNSAETLNDSACLALERRILARHREILSAIHRQDDAAAKQAMREHTRAAATDLKV